MSSFPNASQLGVLLKIASRSLLAFAADALAAPSSMSLWFSTCIQICSSRLRALTMLLIRATSPSITLAFELAAVIAPLAA